tara:strand:+ start:334 stop:2340 length:2007 start_codon:yes stop_codon:yes gene_type:complete
MRINEVDNPVTQAEINQLEVFADRLFAKVGIDVEFTRHFLDRVNDERNVKQITMSELTRLFKQEYKRWGKPIAQLGPDAEAVMKDMATNINLPFALRWDHRNNELDLIAKTVMRKKDFKTSNKEFAVEAPNEGLKSMFRPRAYTTAAERLHSVLQRKKQENDAEGKPFRHALGWYAAKIASGFRSEIDVRELIAYYQKHFDPVLSESTLPYITEEAAIDYWKNASNSDFQKKFNMTRQAANQSIKGNIIQLFPDSLKSSPKVNIRIGNWAFANPDLAKMLGQQAANSNIKPSFWNKYKGMGLKALPKILGGVVLQVLWPSSLADGTISDATIMQHNIIQSMMRSDPRSFMNDIKDYYKTTNNPEGWKDDWEYKQAESYRNDEIAKSLETLKGLEGTVDPALRKAADELAKKMREAKTQKALDDLIGTVDPALQKAVDSLQTTTTINTEVDPKILLNPETSPTDLGFYPMPELNPNDTEKVNPDEIEMPYLFPPTGPEVNPDTGTPNVKDKEIDIEIPKKITPPEIEVPFKQPEAPTGPEVNPDYSPTKPKNPHDPDIPEVPNSKPSDQPDDIEIPQPLNAPPLDIPFIPTTDVTTGQPPEIAFQKDLSIPPAVAAGPAIALTPTGTGTGNNTNKTRKKRKQDGDGSSRGSEYDDPLQRWQKKYGMWDQ